MNKKFKIGIVIAATAVVAAVIILALTLPPSGLTIQSSSWSSSTVFGSSTLHYEGTIVNHENKTANSVQLVLTLFDSSNSIIKTETVDVGDIPAQGSKNVNLDIPYSGFRTVSRVDAHVTWHP